MTTETDSATSGSANVSLEAGAGAPGTKIEITPAMLDDFERILRETGVGYDKAIGTEQLLDFVQEFRAFLENHALSPSSEKR